MNRVTKLLCKDMGPAPKWIFGALLVAMVAGVLYTNGIFRARQPQARIEKTRDAIGTVVEAIENYRVRTGHQPNTVEGLTATDLLLQSHQLLDGWGRPLRLAARGLHIIVESAGADARFDTDDDITN